jgi:hypothetical protein
LLCVTSIDSDTAYSLDQTIEFTVQPDDDSYTDDSAVDTFVVYIPIPEGSPYIGMTNIMVDNYIYLRSTDDLSASVTLCSGDGTAKRNANINYSSGTTPFNFYGTSSSSPNLDIKAGDYLRIKVVGKIDWSNNIKLKMTGYHIDTNKTYWIMSDGGLNRYEQYDETGNATYYYSCSPWYFDSTAEYPANGVSKYIDEFYVYGKFQVLADGTVKIL